MNEQGTESVMNFYRPQTKLREGNVLHVFVRPWRGGGDSAFPQCPLDHTPWDPTPPHELQKQAVRILLKCFLVWS